MASSQNGISRFGRDGGRSLSAVVRFAPRNPGAGARVDAAYVPEIDTFRGTRRLRLRVRDLVALTPRVGTGREGAEVPAE